MTTTIERNKSAQHRPARRARVHDSIRGIDMFSGCGGSSKGIEAAGVDVWYAANHWEYAVELHERNHPRAEHFIADLVNTEAADYYHPEQLPAADVMWASPSCTTHSKSNSQRAYRQNRSLFEIHDPEYEERVTASERSRATAVCVLQYARKHHPRVIVVENVVEFVQWGPQIGNTKKGDGTTFAWWLKELHTLGYRTRVLYLNSMFFGVPQSRDRVYIACWKSDMREPDLEFTPPAHCQRCDRMVEARQTWKPRTKAWPQPQWGKYSDQYVYCCPSCTRQVRPFAMPAAFAIDWSDLGQQIGSKDRPLADSTMERIQRGIDKYFNNGRIPAVVMPAKASGRGTEAQVDDVLPTQTTQQEHMLVSAFQAVLAGHTSQGNGGSDCRARSMQEPMWTQHTTPAVGIVTAPPAFVDNCQGAPRSPSEQLPTQAGSETLGLVAAPFVVANRTNNMPRSASDPLPSITTAESRHLLVHPPAFIAKNNGNDGYDRTFPIDDPLATIVAESNPQGLVVAPMVHTARGSHEGRPAHLTSVADPMTVVTAGGNHQFLLSALFSKQNGGPADTAWHPAHVDALNTLLSADTTCLLTPGELPPVTINQCLYRMLKPTEIQAGMGFDPDFEMWGSARDRVKALGNAVTPPVATWVMERMVAVLRG